MVTIIRKGTSKEEVDKMLNKMSSKKKKNRNKGIMKYAGKLNIQIDPAEFQKEMRNEWE